MPLDRKAIGVLPTIAEVIAVVRVLPNVVSAHHHISSECLLQAGMEFVAVPGRISPEIARRSRRRNQRGQETEYCNRAGDHQVLVEWTLHGPRIGNPQHGVGLI